ncbi:MAG: FAD-dependent monooxygenase [Pegethrix bostrychoides GSE-TBD4-15B]|jgi:2-polyprenyl-6-methoxyphenol hydroxylase-like FAD-dependent oxidoreductase|uniref:FAD-dependent monooxygenase n=1 Tax=Pegethrix bostrychoides GSE-TBD4-15B TaxID=2839662 RepID=A0A951P7P7_9CYAN|nr:FAD-dependent monooxygenase [Pegethrix bostrychoides GSE-TBD4-15B]
MTKTVIVGAGPTGAALAYLLARQGLEVTLIEAAPDFERLFRGEGLMPSGLDALVQMDLQSLLDQIPTQTIQRWEMLVEGCPVVQIDEPAGLQTTIVSQPAFLKAVVAKAQQYPGFRFMQGSVQALIYQQERVAGVRGNQAGAMQEIAADLVIGTDGRGSTLRRLADLRLQRRDYDSNLLWFRLPAPLPVPQRSIFYGFIRGSESLGAYSSWDGSLKLAYILPRDTAFDWKNLDWPTRLAAIGPDWFATHLQTHAAALEAPVLLNVLFGCCPRWFRPGLLLLGDAAHPMAPIRAQGINLALRDVIVAVNQLAPLLKANGTASAIDQALAQIQAEREPEIRRAQTLQQHEQGQANLIAQQPLLRQALRLAAPLTRPLISRRWLSRQKDLRYGASLVRLAPDFAPDGLKFRMQVDNPTLDAAPSA